MIVAISVTLILIMHISFVYGMIGGPEPNVDPRPPPFSQLIERFKNIGYGLAILIFCIAIVRYIMNHKKLQDVYSSLDENNEDKLKTYKEEKRKNVRNLVEGIISAFLICLVTFVIGLPPMGF